MPLNNQSLPVQRFSPKKGAIANAQVLVLSRALILCLLSAAAFVLPYFLITTDELPAEVSNSGTGLLVEAEPEIEEPPAVTLEPPPVEETEAEEIEIAEPDLNQVVSPIPEEPEPPVADEEEAVDPLDEQYSYLSQEVKDLAKQLNLTRDAKKEFYDNDPHIFETGAEVDYDCKTESEAVIIYGCWHVNNIDILRSSGMETTVAHELLHAIYYRLHDENQATELNALLEAFKQENPTEIAEILEFYKSHFTYESEEIRQWAEYSELHSFIGTQFAEIPQQLEEHYARYFNNRQQVVGFYTAWNASHEAKQREAEGINQVIGNQDNQIQNCLNDFKSSTECAPYKADRPAYQAYLDCLQSHRTDFYADCVVLEPAFIAYESPD